MRASLLWISLLTLWACDPEEEADPCVHEPALNYTNWGRGFMSKHCTGCHSAIVPDDHRNEAPIDVNLDTYADVLHFASRIEARVLVDVEDRMPPGGGLTSDELDRLNEWLRCGVFPDLDTP